MEIRNRLSGKVLISLPELNNLSGADLSGANLYVAKSEGKIK